MEQLVSVIVPVYNTADYIEDCVASVINQTWKNIEIIMIDDGSSDDSISIVRNIAVKYSNIKLIQNAHSGVSAARNTGLNEAKGEFVFFLDSDDYIDAELIEQLVNKANAHNADIGISYLRQFGASVSCNVPVKLARDYIEPEDILSEYGNGRNNIFGAIGGKLVRRSLIGDTRFNRNYGSGEDTLFIYELIRRRPGVVICDESFYRYRIHNRNSISSVTPKRINDICTVYRNIYERELADGREAVAYQWYSNEIIFLASIVGEDYSGKEAREAKKLLKREIKRERQNSFYSRIPQSRRVKLFLYSNCGIVISRKQKESDLCTGCGACADICPNGCIELKSDKHGFRRAVIDKLHCNDCGVCKRICPAIADYDIRTKSQYYGLKAQNETIMNSSTSGGAFRLLAESVINEGGFVAGCALVDGVVKHIIADSIEDLVKISGSKYVESDTKGIYLKTLEYLKAGKQVLFSGTPCQIEAMSRIAGNYRDRLILVDLICNGVSSAEAWRRYIKKLERDFKGKLLDYKFRDKRKHDDGHTVSVLFENGEKTWSIYSDKLLKSYFNGNNLRAECTMCKFCQGERNSDITVGDFWGVESAKPEWNDGMGTSLVIVHSEKGQRLFETVSERATVIKLTEREARQPRLLYPESGKKWRAVARTMYGKMPFRLWLKLFGR